LVIGGTGPTGPFIVEGLISRNYEVAIFHRGTHEVKLPESVEHIHGDPHFIETLEQGLGQRSFDLVISMYGRLRYVAQVMKERASRFIAVAGLPYEVLVYGPRQLGPREWSIIRRILDGRRQILVPDGGLKLERRAYAENAAHTVLLAVDKPEVSAGQIYNVGDEKVLSLREWIQIIARTLNYEVELVSMPFTLARPSRPYAGVSHHMVMDISKIKAELGYKDVVPAEEAIRRTTNWYLDNPLQRGGEMEQRLGDSFDYAVEEQVIKEYKETISRLRELASVGFQWRHTYDHPAGPATSS